MGKKFTIIPKCREKGCGKVLEPEEVPFRICLDHYPAHSNPSCAGGFCSARKGVVEG